MMMQKTKSAPPKKSGFFIVKTCVLLLMLICLPATALGRSVVAISDQTSMIEEANQALEAKEYDKAVEAFGQRPQGLFNLILHGRPFVVAILIVRG